MRLGYLVPRLIVVGCIWAFFAFLFDPILRWSVIAAGQAATGAKVEVAGLDTTFFPPSLQMRGVQVANPSAPMTNLVEFDRFRFAMLGRPLLRRKVIIEEGVLTGVEFGTERETSGELPKPEPTADAEGTTSDWDLGLDGYFDTINDQAADLGTAWLDDLTDTIKMELDPNQLESVKLVDTLQTDWKGRLGGLEQRVRDIETKVKSVQAGVKNVEGDPLAKVEAYHRAFEEAQRLMAEAKSIRTELTGLGDAARSDLARIQDVRDKDLETIRSKADLLKMDAGEITESILGPTVTEKLEWAGGWMAWAGRYVTAFSTPKPQRLRGTDFTFPRPDDDVPGFHLKRLLVGGKFQLGEMPLPFEALVTDISSEPRRVGDPIRFKLKSHGDARVEIVGVIDQRPDEPIRDVSITFAYPHATEFAFGEEGDKLRVGVASARTDIKARFRIVGDDVKGAVHLVQPRVNVVSQSGGDVEEQVARVIAASLGNIENLTADVTIGGTFDAPTWKIDSNLGPQVAAGLDQFVHAEFEARKAELLAKANALIDERTSELRSQLDGRFREVVGQLDLEELNAQQLVQRLAGDRFDTNRLNAIMPAGLEDKLNAPIGGPIGDALKDKVGGSLGDKLDAKKVTDKIGEKLDADKILGKNPFGRFRRN